MIRKHVPETVALAPSHSPLPVTLQTPLVSTKPDQARDLSRIRKLGVHKLGVFLQYSIWIAVLGLLGGPAAKAQGAVPEYKIDPSWPKPLPHYWVLGGVGGVCIDHQDHIFALNRSIYNNNYLDAGEKAPLVLEFNTAGDLLNSWGNPAEMPKGAFHGCAIDSHDHIWLISESEGVVQEYSETGKLLLQVGKIDVFDSTTGTFEGKALNSAHDMFFGIQGIAVDKDDNVYVTEGMNPSTNHRVVVLDHAGHFLRQWEIERTPGVPPDWAPMADCVRVDKDNNVYVGDRLGNRFLVYDTMGHFKTYVSIPQIKRTKYTPEKPISFAGFSPGHWGTVIDILLSSDPEQKYLIDLNEDNEEVVFINRKTLKVETRFGRVGMQLGEFDHVHFGQMDSKGNLYLGEVDGNRLDRFVPVNNNW